MPQPGKTILSINVTPDELERVNQLARDRGYRITSDYLRQLIEADAAAHNDDFTFSLERGGSRTKRPPR